MSDHQHLIGLLLGTEEDWPTAFEAIVGMLGPVVDGRGTAHHYGVERITIEPFDLCSRPRYDLVIDRLAYWYYHPREWLKKAALMDDVYLLNSPFTFQSMEKHAAYCAMLRLGLHVPDTVLIPYKNPMGLMAYYAGVFALIPCVGLVLGPAAFILGILGIRYANKYPTAGGKGHAIAGIVLGALVILGHLVGIVLLGLGMFLGR